VAQQSLHRQIEPSVAGAPLPNCQRRVTTATTEFDDPVAAVHEVEDAPMKRTVPLGILRFERGVVDGVQFHG
jgi:hypothetical protein